jgi:formate hydrogenlyase subunit 3/multisubunit Na+/H+ antiporter MnhD subunit
MIEVGMKLNYLYLLSIGLPLILGALLIIIRLNHSWVVILASWASLPALILSLWIMAAPEMTGDIRLPWFLVGIELGLDHLAAPFLFFTSMLWMVAGIYGYSYIEKSSGLQRFFGFFSASMAGNIGLVLARDMVSFYLFFALMTFSAYGLVVHSGSAPARRAGRIYIILAVIGESLVITAMLLIVSAGGMTDFKGISHGVAISPFRDVIIGLVLAGFGIKAGILPLHVWLPLAHPVAPTPASAVLSGAMIKAGLLAWLRFLPLGEGSFPEWGVLCVAIGLAGALYAVAVGLPQDDPKTVLAYSSVSQMGILTIGLGVGLMEGEAWPVCLSAISVYSLHHGLTKGALFLGVGVADAAGHPQHHRLIVAGLILSSLGLAGAPLTSGFVAKSALKDITSLLPDSWSGLSGWLLPLTSTGTTLLMGRFLLLLGMRSRGGAGKKISVGLWLPWAALVVLAGMAVWLWSSFDKLVNPGRFISSANLSAALWPILTGGLIAWGVYSLSGRIRIDLPVRIPPGDLLELLSNLPKKYRVLQAAAHQMLYTGWKRKFLFGLQHLDVYREMLLSKLHRTEKTLSQWTPAMIIFLLMAAILFAWMFFIPMAQRQ